MIITYRNIVVYSRASTCSLFCGTIYYSHPSPAGGYRGRDKDETQRQEEWKLDVPTIGYTYSRPSTPCIIYFNGLGLPLDTSPAVLGSTRQWFNRVWTLQESPLSWLPGGLTGKPLVDPQSFFDRLRSIVTAVNSRGDGSGLAQTLRERSCTNELDRIAGLAYIFRCPTLPIYDENVSPEIAWILLLKHMDAQRRTVISLRYPPCSPFGLWGSWQRFLHSSETPHVSQPLISAGTSEDGSLRLNHVISYWAVLLKLERKKSRYPVEIEESLSSSQFSADMGYF
ncbi:uncharacterized protein PHACADRAFT_194031 [Phanerochaete carnosa HHB-10118-sp]|uniref:Uncharacterized protein n=1 Tax=Phanerochaete carnosa (strain HHB-10118-sp) TaxID=650164 RepID=K5WBR9_PHACS|nr:uncharacterized protein PHACADRAFT_194031 [Phanerochaete carnosa HHB-10118-sp]EKM56419.1 hypothetical protein PHACADRAFT_194031 [Phanerochaete carnosa HHB-10118-sp]